MKCHTGVDAGSGFVHTAEATAANVRDITMAAKLLREDDEVVYGDSAYLGIEKRDEIKQDEHLSAMEYRINRRSGRLPRISDNAIDWERYIENRKAPGLAGGLTISQVLFVVPILKICDIPQP